MHLGKRSYFYNLEPIGKDTEYIESLSSYIIRLSNLHCLSTGTIMSKIISTNLQKTYLLNIAEKGGDGFYKSSNAVNGSGIIASDFVKTIEQLTTRNDLQNSTLLKLKNLFPTRGLLKDKKAWCPSCFEEMITNGEIYEPLIWSFSIVKVCPRHNILLEDHCYNCNSKQNILSRKNSPGFCNKCFIWLGETGNKSVINNLDVHLQQSIFICELVKWSVNSDEINYTKDNIVTSLIWIVKNIFKDNIHKAAINLGYSYSSFRCWYKGENQPTIKVIADICTKLNISIIEFFNIEKREGAINYSPNPVNINDKKDRKKYEHSKIKLLLEVIISDQVLISIKKIAMLIGCDRRLLSKCYPEECTKIVENNKLLVESRKEERFVEVVKIIEDTFYKLIKENQYPSIRNMEVLLGENKLREKVFREKYYKLKELYDLLLLNR